jgi:hypothetical protein
MNGERAWAAARVMPALPAFLRRSRRVILPGVVSDLVFFNEVSSIYVRRNTLERVGIEVLPLLGKPSAVANYPGL